MSCAQCRGVEQEFNSRWVRMERAMHRLLGPPRTTERLIRLLSADGVVGRSLLDVGGGLGEIQAAFAERGARRIEVVDAASAYLDAARMRAEEDGYVGRATFRAGDFVELAPQVEPADFVALDRVICCYDDVVALLEAAASRCGFRCGLVYPRRLFAPFGCVANVSARLRRSPFRFFLHDEALVRNTLAAAGLRLEARHPTVLWNVEVYRR